jgi:NADPH:quinone reductase-like Zn-dependent oxidoreductase
VSCRYQRFARAPGAGEGCGVESAFHSNDAKGSAGKIILQWVIHEVEAGVYRPNIDRVFGLDDIVAAHRYMENNQAIGKLVVVP